VTEKQNLVWLTLAAIFIGAFVGLGIFTFGYGEGFAYLTSRPEACNNCHIMNDQYNSWVKGSHHSVARCVDCHLPHSLIPKYISKMDNGFFHSWAFTFENFHQPIQIKKRNMNILQKNCITCHAEMVSAILPGGAEHYQPQSCTLCHANVGHAATR
jgi:cytochrome c nitrite reductase small subunit